MATIGNLVVNILGNSSQFQQTLNQSTAMLDGFKSRVLGTMAGVAAAFSLGKAADAAKEQIKAEQKLAAVLKATGGAAGLSARQITDYASSLQKATNFGDDEIISAASFMATFKNIKGDVFKQTLGLSLDKATITGLGLKETMVQLGKAVNDPIAGYSALAEVGVQFTEQQKRQIKTLQESGNLLGAQKIILDQVMHKFGGAAAAVASPWIQMKNTIKNVMENIGYLILPTMALIASAVNDAFGGMGKHASDFKATGEAIAQGLRPAVKIMGFFLSIVSDLMTVFAEAPTAVGALTFALGALATAVTIAAVAYKAASLAKALFMALSGPAGLVAIGAAALAVGALGMAMHELHEKFVQGTADKREETSVTKKAAEAIKEEAKAVRLLREERKKADLAEAKRLTDTVQGMGFGLGAGDDKRSKMIRDFERFNSFKNDRKLFPNLPESVRKMDLDPSRNKDVANAISNSISGIIDAIKEAQIETKILNKEMTEIDKTIASFADKKATQDEPAALRKALEIKEQTARITQHENDMLERSKSIIKDLQTPLEQLKEKFDEIGYLQGLGMLSDAQAEAARTKAANELIPQGADGSFGAVGAAEQGSQAAFGAIQAAIRSGSRDEVPKQQLDIAKKQLAELEESNKLRREQAQAPVGLPIGI